MNNDQKDNLLTVGGSLKSWSSAIELISILVGVGGVWALICMYVYYNVSIAVLFVGSASFVASAATGFLIAKCLEGGSLALQFLNKSGK